ncbi:hypothetical protein ACIA58_40055 [Kribbella sp. NPDC051586]|uniref:hypothetical protein n=1 Tax=Kribbella sp. NPDC051586 TaxID=3364118 RepID=UPI003799F94E
MITPPPELRPEVRARQRAELTAIVAHEATTPVPHRRLVPLLAAAAVLAVTAGLAFGIPALHQRTAPAPADQPSPAPAVTPLSAADKARFGKLCFDKAGLPIHRGSSRRYQVLDGFTFTTPPADAYTPTWVVIKAFGLWTTCGLDAKGTVRQALPEGANQDQYRAVETRMIGAGSYAAHITRITVAVGNQTPVEAVLRHGFYYTATPYVRVRGPRADSTPREYVVRGYDAAGKLVYTSPKTDGEFKALSNSCYLNPNGKLTAWMTGNPHPDPKTCRQGYFWTYQPK